MPSFFSVGRRGSCDGSVVSLSASQDSLSSKASRSTVGSSVAASLAQARQATSAAWNSLKGKKKRGTSTAGKSKKKPSPQSPPPPLSSSQQLENPFTDHAYGVDADAELITEPSRVGRLRARLGRQKRYASLEEAGGAYSSSSKAGAGRASEDALSRQPLWSSTTTTTTTMAGTPGAGASQSRSSYAPYEDDDDDWYS